MTIEKEEQDKLFCCGCGTDVGRDICVFNMTHNGKRGSLIYCEPCVDKLKEESTKEWERRRSLLQ